MLVDFNFIVWWIISNLSNIWVFQKKCKPSVEDINGKFQGGISKFWEKKKRISGWVQYKKIENSRWSWYIRLEIQGIDLKKMISSTILFFCESALDDKRTHYVAGKEWEFNARSTKCGKWVYLSNMDSSVVSSKWPRKVCSWVQVSPGPWVFLRVWPLGRHRGELDRTRSKGHIMRSST